MHTGMVYSHMGILYTPHTPVADGVVDIAEEALEYVAVL
jgi:hypothetical protein